MQSGIMDDQEEIIHHDQLQINAGAESGSHDEEVVTLCNIIVAAAETE